MIQASGPVSDLASQTPEVSVVIPCYDQAHFLPDAIRSVDGASRTIEVIVVDDGSRDDTSVVARGFQRVRCVRQANQGLAGARNRGLRESRGRFVVFLDADDRLLPGAIDTGAATMEAHPECAMVYGRCVMMGPDGRFWPTREHPRIERDHHREFLRNNPIWMPGTAMFRREALEAAGGFATGFDAAADYDLYLRLAATAPVYDHAKMVAAYRRHDGNMSGNAVRMLRDTDAVMRRNRPRDARLLADWRSGCAQWRTFYGTHLVEEVRAHIRSNEPRKALVKSLALLRWHPALAIQQMRRKVQLALARSARPAVPR